MYEKSKLERKPIMLTFADEEVILKFIINLRFIIIIKNGLLM